MIRRKSPWGPLTVHDAHVHFFAHSFFEKLIEQKPGLTIEGAAQHLGWQMPPADARGLADVWVKELDAQGVASAAMIASLPGEQASVTEASVAHPERLIPFAMVNPRQWEVGGHFDPARLGAIRAACLFPAMHQYSIQDPVVKPVLEWASKNQRAVFVHCGVLSVGVRKRLGLASAFDLRFSNPIDLQAVATRHPEIPFIVPHFGAGFFREALMLADMCPNVYLDTSSSNSWMRYQAGHVDLREVFRHALAVAGPGRLLFGTDSSYFPRGWHSAIFEDQATALYELGVSEADAGQIFGENLLRILQR